MTKECLKKKMNKKIHKLAKEFLAAFLMMLLSGFANSSEELPLIAVGKIEHIDLAESAVYVNGQRIVLDNYTEVHSSDVSLDGYIGLSELTLFDYVAIGGENIDAGTSLATVIAKLDEAYVDGSSPAYLRAVISSSSGETGIALSGNSLIDYTGSLHSSENPKLAAGQLVEFFGTTIDSSFEATQAKTLGSLGLGTNMASVQAIRGSGVRAIRGSGVRAIRGSGVRAIRGSGVRAIRGSGVRAIRGSGVRAIRGSGVRAIRGSGVRAIRGSGVRAIRGSGVRAIRGSGIR